MLRMRVGQAAVAGSAQTGLRGAVARSAQTGLRGAVARSAQTGLRGAVSTTEEGLRAPCSGSDLLNIC